MKWFILYDKLNLILQSLYYKKQVPVTKGRLLSAAVAVAELEKDVDVQAIQLGFKLITFTLTSINALQDGTVDDRIKVSLTDIIRRIQHSIAVYLVEQSAFVTMPELTPQVIKVGRQIVTDALLGSDTIE